MPQWLKCFLKLLLDRVIKSFALSLDHSVEGCFLRPLLRSPSVIKPIIFFVSLFLLTQHAPSPSLVKYSIICIKPSSGVKNFIEDAGIIRSWAWSVNFFPKFPAG